MSQAVLPLACPPPETCGACVVRNGPPELEFAGCARTNSQRHRDDPACADGFGRQELNGPLYGHGKGKTWPEVIREAVDG